MLHESNLYESTSLDLLKPGQFLVATNQSFLEIFTKQPQILPLCQFSR